VPADAPAARLTTAQISAALKRAGRRGTIPERTALIRAALRSPQLAQPPQVTAAGAAVVRALTAVITTVNQQIKALEGQVEAHFRGHPDAEIILSQPRLGPILGARVLAEFGDDPTRYACAKARKNYAAASPITCQSGKKKTVMARYVHNDRLRDALGRQAYSALTASAGARAYYGLLRARNMPTKPRCGNWPTAWSASSTAASKPAPSTTRRPPGHSKTTANSPPPLDTPNPWDVSPRGRVLSAV